MKLAVAVYLLGLLALLAVEAFILMAEDHIVWATQVA